MQSEKNVLVVGSSGDIGIKIAEQLIKDDYQVILHYNKNKEVIEKFISKVSQENILSIVQADLSDKNGIKEFIKQLVFSIDAVIFASGKAYFGLFQDMTEEMMDKMMTLHVKAPWMITKYLLPHMVKNKSGKVIFITSIWGSDGASNEVIYSSVKGAQNSFVKSLAKEVAPSGIRVNAVSPGFINTKMNNLLSQEEMSDVISGIPIGRPGLPEEVAQVVSFLMSEKSSYIQGEIINVTGGW